MTFLWIDGWLTIFSICRIAELIRIIEKSERIHHTHEDESESDYRYDEHGSSGSQVFFRPIKFPSPTVDNFSVFENTETHGDSEERIENFYEKHTVYLIDFIILQESSLMRIRFVP